MVDPQPLAAACAVLRSLGLLSDAERRAAVSVSRVSFPFAAEARRASAVHLHVKVDGEPPREALERAGWQPRLERPGFLEYLAAPGVTVSFSSIPIAEDEQVTPGIAPPRPFLDHVGFDFPADEQAAFDAIPARARAAGWGHVAQGNDGRPVHCCFAVMSAKHWVFPPPWTGGPPVEFSIGELESDSALMGTQLRPSRPE